MTDAIPSRAAAYRTIVADPPWEQGGYPTHAGGRVQLGRGDLRRDPLPYASLSVSQIKELPIATLAADDARLFLWTTNRFLPHAFGIAEAWGFVYRQMLVWDKRGCGTPFVAHIAPNHAEFLLACVRGRPQRCGSLSSSVITADVNAFIRHHSRKPDAFQDLVEQVSPGPYLELFARRQRLGWDTWGDQALNHVGRFEDTA